MQPAQRKDKILKAIVESYIQNGEPVGSKVLCSMLDFTVSSATVRNEMAELSQMGFITQPHTSAGRVPSQEGYRYYVEHLMEKKNLPSSDKVFIYDSLSRSADEPEKLLAAVSDTAAKLTSGCVISTTPSSKNARIHRLKFVQTGRQTCMVVVITTSGLIKTRLFKCDYLVTPDIVGIYEKLFNRNMEGLPVIGITPAFVQTMAAEMGELAMLVPGVLRAIMDACSEVCGVSMKISGRVNLINGDDSDIMHIRELTEFLHSEEAVESLVGRMKQRAVMIGAETGFEALCGQSIFSQPYSIEKGSEGVITAICPMRCDYAYVIGIMEYISDCVSRMLKDLLMVDE